MHGARTVHARIEQHPLNVTHLLSKEGNPRSRLFSSRKLHTPAKCTTKCTTNRIWDIEALEGLEAVGQQAGRIKAKLTDIWLCLHLQRDDRQHPLLAPAFSQRHKESTRFDHPTTIKGRGPEPERGPVFDFLCHTADTYSHPLGPSQATALFE